MILNTIQAVKNKQEEKKSNFSKAGRYLFYLLILLIIAITLCEINGWSFLRQPAEKFLSQKLQRTVVLRAPFKLHVIGGIKLELGGLYISAPSNFDADYLLDSKNVKLSLRYIDIIQLKPKQALRLQSLYVGSMDAKLIRNSDGHATWQFESDDSSAKPNPVFETLVIKNGTARFDDPITHSALDLSFNTTEGSTINKLASQLMIKGQFRKKSLIAKIATNGFLPIAAQDATSVPITTSLWLDYGNIHVDFKGMASDLLGTQNIQGMFNIQGASLGVLGDLLDTPLPTTDPFKLNGSIKKEGVFWFINVAKASIARSRLSADLRYDPRSSKPLLSGKLSGSQLFLADLAPAFGTKTEYGSPSQKRAGHVIPDRPIDLPALNKMNMQIRVDLAYIDLGTAFNHPISPFKADLSIEEGQLSLKNIVAKTADGSLSGLISVDAHMDNANQVNEPVANPTPKWKIDLTWRNINLEKWLKISEIRKQDAKNKGEKSLPPAYVTGQLSGRTTLSGTGNSTAKLLGSLDGNVAMVIQNGSISRLVIEMLGLDLAQSLGLLIKGDEAVPLQCAVLDWRANQGLLTPTVAVADTPVTQVLMNGNLNLATESLDLTLTAKPKNISPLTARSPIQITGTLSEPKVSPKSGPIAARLAGGLALMIINPLAAILPFIDLGGSPTEAPCKQIYSDFKKP